MQLLPGSCSLLPKSINTGNLAKAAVEKVMLIVFSSLGYNKLVGIPTGGFSRSSATLLPRELLFMQCGRGETADRRRFHHVKVVWISGLFRIYDGGPIILTFC